MQNRGPFSIFRRNGSLRITVYHLFLAMVIPALFGTPVQAEIRPGAYSISPFLGGFLFEGNQDLKHRPVFGARFGYDFTSHWGVEALFDYVPTRYTLTESNTDVYNYRIEGIYHFMPERKLVPFLSAGAGGMSMHSKDDAVDKNRAVFDYGAGVKYSLTEQLALRADVRHVVASGSAYHNLEYTLGLVFYFGGAKAVAASTARESGGPASMLRPEPPAVVRPGPPASPEPLILKALPVSPSRIDLDWNAPAGASSYRIFRDGSPLTVTKETYASDQGLNANTRYCYRVSALDAGNNDISSSNEACAVTLTTPASMPETTAAPAPQTRMLENIHFDFDRFNLKPEAQAILKRHAAWMIENSDVILTIVVEGHCDERGTAEYNMALGQRRAHAAARYLVDLGVDAKRIAEISYGFSRPLDPGHNEEAWAKNRRASFLVTEKK